MRQERVENKVHHKHIKKLQGDLLIADSEVDKGKVTQNILAEKERTIQLLKENCKFQQLI